VPRSSVPFNLTFGNELANDESMPQFGEVYREFN
jgi:hypothetical protein